MQATTALRKITALRKKYRVVQGGQGAGKTIAIALIMINHCNNNRGKEMYVLSEELSKMRDTVLKDFVKILQALNVRCSITGLISGQPRIDFPNKSFIRFIGLDKEDIGKGLRSDCIYVNEANKTLFESVREAFSRTKNVYIDFNPNAEFWVHEHIITRDDADFITLTFLDNEFLSDEERDEILRYKKLGYGPDGKIINKYWANKWRVYGLGQIGMLEGAVFEDWEEIAEIPKEAILEGYGMDFGWVVPTSMVGVYRWNKTYILDEVIHEPKLTNQDIAEMAIEAGVGSDLIYADSAEPKSISEIEEFGINIHPCDSKVDINAYGTQKLQQTTFYITKRSTNVIREFRGALWDTDSRGKPTGKIKKINDHSIQATFYFIGTVDKFTGKY